MNRLSTTTLPRTPRVLSTLIIPHLRQSSGSPTAGGTPLDHFTKTGEKEQDPAKVNTRSYEYSQSGGDDMVAGQSSASYDHASNDPAISKTTAGKGNAVNPLEFSPASPDLSKTMRDTVCSDSPFCVYVCNVVLMRVGCFARSGARSKSTYWTGNKSESKDGGEDQVGL
ncbi:hypothetical protein FB567DRAFT_260539 [Paraphoma chrysanthemicola]|uniref:Uncharacterized protein n=1 Tax=Paraphoma chrysanthemicola TaxID=798071 RepID=A0A8K0QSP9_9PLEO|nr:hypothetical protein FB567DRAFT_260539 [Paraphoma chrysanthemicola]